ncbi:MAG TPA: hypothetical protein VM582_09945, partial [Candidatus Thermoplasmatota archaeon]|nr:hypothetical protein [Candidatus Thermoplasmatota archaeon]
RRLAIQGRLSHPQLAFIERRASELTAAVRKRQLTEDYSFLPLPLFLMLEEMVADGRVTMWEHRQLVDALERTPGLTSEQRQRVRDLVHGWLEHDAARPRL